MCTGLTNKSLQQYVVNVFLFILPPVFMNISNTLWVASLNLMDIKFSVLFFSNNLVLFLFCYMADISTIFMVSSDWLCWHYFTEIFSFYSSDFFQLFFFSHLPSLTVSLEFFIFHHEGLTFVHIEITIFLFIYKKFHYYALSWDVWASSLLALFNCLILCSKIAFLIKKIFVFLVWLFYFKFWSWHPTGNLSFPKD